MADYLSTKKMNAPFDMVKIQKLHCITGETQRYRLTIGFYTEATEVDFCITQDELDSLKKQIEEMVA